MDNDKPTGADDAKELAQKITDSLASINHGLTTAGECVLDLQVHVNQIEAAISGILGALASHRDILKGLVDKGRTGTSGAGGPVLN